jgi:hypothetical protein
MSTALAAPARMLFRWALGIFVVTIVIGILNGTDLWDPPRTILLTHVHAGTLGWITLAVVGVVLMMFGSDEDVASGTRVAQVMAGATVLYVLAFATTTNIIRPITGTLMLAAIVYAFAWVNGRRANAAGTVAGLAMYLAMISLMIGAVLGVLLGLFVARGSLPGLSQEMAGSLAGAHPPAMLAGYLLMAGFAVAEWRLSSVPASTRESRSGTGAVVGLFVAGLLFNIAFIFDIEALIQLASLLQVIAVVVFVVRMRSHLGPDGWQRGGMETFARWSVVWLVIGVGLLVYLVQLFVSGEIDPEAGEGINILLAFDHALFVGLMTNALLATTGLTIAWDKTQQVIAWAVNLGLAAFIVGLLSESDAIKRVATPVLGAALLVAIYTHVMQRETPATV